MPGKKRDQIHRDKQIARILYVQSGFPANFVADAVGVSANTVNAWARLEKWQELQAAVRLGPDRMKTSIYAQFEALVAVIEKNGNVPTPAQADTQIKLVRAIEAMRVESSVGQTVQALEGFIDFAAKHDPEAVKPVARLMAQYLNTLS